RHYADDGIAIPVEDDGMPEYTAIEGKPVAPELIPQHHDAILSGVFLFWKECAPQERCHSEQPEHAGCHLECRELLGVANACESWRPVLRQPHALIRATGIL